MEIKKEPEISVLTHDHIIMTFKNVRPKIKEYLAEKSVTKKEIDRILYLTINKLFKSNLQKKITQDKINDLILERLNEAAYVVLLARYERGKILTLLDTCIISKSVDSIFNEMEITIFSDIAA